jgi:hypothetical protein
MKKLFGTIYVPRECMSNLLVSLAAVIVFVCAAIIPAYLSRVDIQQKISNARYRLDQHQALLPLYESLKKAPRADFPALANPVKTALKKDNVSIALTAVRDIADKSALTVGYINPDISDSSAHTKSIALDVSLKGSFENFRTMLASIGALPYVENLENISIQRAPNGQALDFKIKIILALS